MKTILQLLFIFIILSGCQKFKETLSLKKKESVDEFLIERKNPLTLPPDFTDLPKPNDVNQKAKTKKENLDLSEILGSPENKKKDKETSEIEKSISNILKK